MESDIVDLPTVIHWVICDDDDDGDGVIDDNTETTDDGIEDSVDNPLSDRFDKFRLLPCLK